MKRTAITKFTVAEEVSSIPVRVYINVAVMGHVNDVLQQQLELLHDSGLYLRSSAITLLVNGDASLLKINIADPANKIYISNLITDINSYEFPALHQLWVDASESDFAVLYLHTKGVSKPNQRSVKDWVNYLLYFNVEDWRNRLKELLVYDCTGVNLRGSASNPVEHPENWFIEGSPLHYSGNFWWARSVYIRQLPDPYLFQTDSEQMLRYYCEMWLLQQHGSFHCAWYSGVLHHKEEPYPPFLYRKGYLNQFLRMIIGKPFRVYIQLLRSVRKYNQ